MLPAWPIAPPGGWNSTVDKGFPLLFFLKKEGCPQPVRWSRPPAPTSTIYQKEKEKTRERRSLKKLLYMHYPKSRTTGAAFCIGRICFFYNGGEGERRAMPPRFREYALFSRRENIPKRAAGHPSPLSRVPPLLPKGRSYVKRAEGGVVMLIWLLFPPAAGI